MRRKTKLVILFFIVIVGFILNRPIMEFYFRHIPGQSVEDQLSLERGKLMPPDTIIEIINPSPGSIVLDLGAGYGFFTFPLARAVGAAGKVFATDIDHQAIRSLDERIRKDGATNIIPVLVKSSGVDPFYRRHTFDVILAADVLSLIESPEELFTKLGQSLRPESGRLWIVDIRLDPDFTALEFENSTNLIDLLRSNVVPTAIVNRMSATTRQALADTSTTGTPDFTAQVVEDLNRMLENSTLWPEAKAQKWPLNPRDVDLRQCLITMLEQNNVFTSKSGKIEDTDRSPLRLLNRILISDLFSMDLWGKAARLNELHTKQLKQLMQTLTTPMFHGAPPVLVKVGFVLVREHKSMPYCRIWELKRGR